MDRTPQDREEKVAMIRKYFGIIMAIFYFTIGAAVLFSPMFQTIETQLRYIFAGMLILYGVFRLYRIFKS